MNQEDDYGSESFRTMQRRSYTSRERIEEIMSTSVNRESSLWLDMQQLLDQHAALVEALRELLGTLGEGGYFPTAGKTITDRARAALAAAEGE